MKIQLKRSLVVDGTTAKAPTAEQLDYGELAVNYSTQDPAIFFKDADNNVIRLAGAGYDYNDLINKPTIGDGTLTINNYEGGSVGTFTANQTGNTSITLPQGFSGDYNDLQNQPTIGNGTITITQPGTTPQTFTVQPDR